MEKGPIVLRLLTVMALIGISHGKLIELDKEPNYPTRVGLGVSGTWNSWGTWSPCSRTCGGGVAVQTRDCVSSDTDFKSKRTRRRTPSENDIRSNHQTDNENKGLQPYDKPSCIGLDKRYHECNTLACPGPERDFRAEQCSAFDKKRFKGRYFIWLPYIDKKNPCQLNCRPAGKSFYASLAQTIDGTSCHKPGFRAVCVQGQCKAVGLNGVVSQWSGSGAGPGQGSYRCGSRLVSGLFTRTQLPLGYTLIATLPPGACRINVTEMQHSNNFLALKTTNGSFIINGNFAISGSGEYAAAGTKFLYRRQGGNLVESISAAGPLLQSIDVMILYQHPNLGIRYEYTIQPSAEDSEKNPAPAPPLLIAPKQNVTYPSRAHHISQHPREDVDENSIVQKDPSPKAVDESENAISPKRADGEKYPYGIGVLATESEKPKHNQHTIQRHRRRRYVWKTTGYTSCSKSCAGLQTRTLACVREHNQSPVSEKRCGAKPPNPARSCGGPCTPRWETESWGPCSASCGPSTQTRTVECKQDLSFQALDVKVVDALCPDPRPISIQKCQLSECAKERIEIQLKSNELSPPKYESGRNEVPRAHPRSKVFKNGDTDRFTDSLGQGILTRNSSKNYDVLSNEISSNGEGLKYKNGHWKASNAWMRSEWTQECTEECGKGLQTRMVKCADPSGCDERRKPDDSRACSSDRKCTTQSSKWFTGPWSPCSNPCAINSKMTREVVCISYYKGQHRVNVAACAQNTKPDTERPCPPSMLRGDCPPEWFIGDWSQCLGPCGSTQQTRLVTCQSSSGTLEGTCAAPRPANRRDCVPSHCHINGFTPAPKDSKDDNSNEKPFSKLSNEECVDKVPTCRAAVQARLCQYEFYANLCCSACRKAPSIS